MEDFIRDVKSREGFLESRFSHRVVGQYWYGGVMYNKYVSQKVLEGLPDMHLRPGDCLLVGYPKSGTTWIQEVVWLLQNGLNIAQCQQIPTYVRIPFLEDHHTERVEKCPSPRTLKSHIQANFLPLQAQENGAKVIFILRNPKDVAVSYYHFYRSIEGLGNFQGTWDEFFQMFLAGYVVCGSWFEHTIKWWPLLQEPNVHVVMYEEMKLKPRDTILKLATFLGKQVTEEQINVIMKQTSFDVMKDNPMTNFKDLNDVDDNISPFIRKGVVGDWKQYFSREQNETFEQVLEQTIGHINLEFPNHTGENGQCIDKQLGQKSYNKKPGNK